eukprot:COSAG02_NODE_64308_length_261_cov_0.512346_1_plen_73_part_01
MLAGNTGCVAGGGGASLGMMALPAVASADGAEGGTVWPVKSPVTDSAAGQIQAAYRRKRGRASQKRVSRALFQ